METEAAVRNATKSVILKVWRRIPTPYIAKAMMWLTSGVDYSKCTKTDIAECLATGNCLFRQEVVDKPLRVAEVAKGLKYTETTFRAEAEARKKALEERFKARTEEQTKRFENRLARAKANGSFENDDLRSLLRVTWQIMDRSHRELFLERTSINGD